MRQSLRWLDSREHREVMKFDVNSIRLDLLAVLGATNICSAFPRPPAAARWISSFQRVKGEVVVLQGTLRDESDEEQHRFLSACFEEVFNHVGLDRPLNLHNFPGRR
jgi:hypothetical protein